MSDKDYEELYIKNENLVYKFASQYNLLHNEDMMQNLKLALFRAIKRYDETKGFSLSTYAYISLFHEYKYSFRDKHLKLHFVSNVIKDDEDKYSSIFDFIPDESNVDPDYELYKEDIMTKINNYLITYDIKYREIFYDYYFNNTNQKDLAKKHNISQAQVSRKIKTIIKDLQNLLKDYY